MIANKPDVPPLSVSNPGSALRARRERSGVSLRALARAMGISAPYLVDLELGRRPVNPTMGRRYRKSLAEIR